MKPGPVDTSSSPHAQLRTIPLDYITLADGFWSERQRTNRTVSLRHGYRQLEAHGNFNNLRLVGGWPFNLARTSISYDNE